MFEGNYIPFTSQSSQRQIVRIRKDVKEWLDKKGKLTDRMVEEIDHFAAYSVRHLAIKQLIIESKYSIIQVAEKCQTSVSMIEDFYYRYGQNPEERLVSRSPEPEGGYIATTDSEVLESLAKTLKVDKAKGKGRNYD